jgi:hypothetical protein
MSSRGRGLAMMAGALAVLGVALYLILSPPDARTSSAGGGPVTTGLAGAQLMVRAVDPNDPFANGRVFVVKAGQERQLSGSPLDCERVDFAGGSGVCMTIAERGREGETTIFDASLRRLARAPLAGMPLQARVSSDGRLGALTAVANANVEPDDEVDGVASETAIVDMRSGRELADLASFRISRGGHAFQPAEPRFSSVTFAKGSDRFFATLRAAGRSYLVEGSIARRTMRVLRDGIEAPSLSPDGRRLACKAQVGEDRWRLAVLDLATMRLRPLTEHRQIEEQVEWLNDDALVYSDGFDVYTVAAEGSGSPRLVLRNATSPVALPGET